MNILQYGDQGVGVVDAQNALRMYGYPLKADGDFGSATIAAVRSFQRFEHLDVDGEIGPATRARLDFYNANPDIKTPVELQATISAPLWVTNGLHEVGIAEVIGRGSNPKILEFARQEGGEIAREFTSDDIAWCSLYANHLLTSVGLPGTETLWALDWDSDRTWPNVRLDGPAVGAFIPMKRKGGGHIACVVGRNAAGNLMALEGNTGNRVTVGPIARDRPLSYRWPKRASLPTLVGFDKLPLVTSSGHLGASEA